MEMGAGFGGHEWAMSVEQRPDRASSTSIMPILSFRTPPVTSTNVVDSSEAAILDYESRILSIMVLDYSSLFRLVAEPGVSESGSTQAAQPAVW